METRMTKEILPFSGFTRETEEFLWGIHLNNDRSWFLEHKQVYLDSLYEPMKALTREVHERLAPMLPLDTVSRCCRIYRDARLHDKRGPYKDRLWFTVSTSLQWVEDPVFYFEIRPTGAEYGMGCYAYTPAALGRLRASIDANPGRVQRLLDDIDRAGIFQIYGEDYKRPKGVFGTSVDRIYNKKYFGFSRELKWGRELTAKNLPKKLADHLATLGPLFAWLMEVIPERED